MSKKDLQKFGKKLKFLRIDKGLTQLELAEILNMSPNFIGMIERGERNTTVENVFKISRALKVKASSLFEDSKIYTARTAASISAILKC